VSAGIARLALLGWLLGRVLAGVPLAALIGPVSAVARAIGLRGGVDYARTMVAHGTAARVQARLRQMVHAHVLALGPAHFTAARTRILTHLCARRVANPVVIGATSTRFG
jgi:ATP-binding cassette, subfamily B, bacterial